MEMKTVDLATLDQFCDKLECRDEKHRYIAEQIRKAMNGVPSWSSLKGVLSEDKRQLPEGIEWPRFEDGELVKFGPFLRAVWDKHGVNGWVPSSIEFFPSGRTVIHARGLMDEIDTITLKRGEPVKRPESEVLDADGVPIKVGDTVWYGHESECTVLCITRYDGEAFLDLSVNGANWNVGGVKPSEVTHRKPDTQEAINADLEEAFRLACEQVGDTIWFNDTETLLDRVEFILERQRKLMGGE